MLERRTYASQPRGADWGGGLGLTFSRSVRFGPVRFNFSGSGIGVSTGIKGLRIGTGPRGAYISAGRGGFRYRASLGGGRPVQTAPAMPVVSPSGNVSVPEASSNIIATQQHDTLSVLSLSDSNSDALLAAMNEQAKKTEWWPFLGGGLLLLLVWANQFMANWPAWVVLALFAAAALATGWLRHTEKLKRLTVLFFEPDDHAANAFAALVASTKGALNVRKLQSVMETATYADKKYQAGATRGLKLGKASVSLGQAPGVLANIDVPILTSGRTTFAFYPDRVLAFQNKVVGAMNYRDLQATSSPSTFIEMESLPSDATVVDRTWQYVNKKGGPDKRFKNNRQYPVCQYNQLRFASPRGLDVRFQASRAGAFDEFVGAIQGVAAVTA
jgi:hypothetical protein